MVANVYFIKKKKKKNPVERPVIKNAKPPVNLI